MSSRPRSLFVASDQPDPVPDTTVCVDDDCPWPEHSGECPAPTLENWRAEAQRCRRLVGQLADRLFEARDMFKRLFGAPTDEVMREKIDALAETVRRGFVAGSGCRWSPGPTPKEALAELVQLAKTGRCG